MAHLAADDKNKRDGTWTVQERLKSCLGCSPYKEDVADRAHLAAVEDVDFIYLVNEPLHILYGYDSKTYVDACLSRAFSCTFCPPHC